ncbi:MAG TPA: IPT/TIG domain-containing protein [Dehalococcoidia bacterium]|nr:IPT/TIG domain-containing protein [Dehalococcoidia bacterium]
MVSVTDYGAVPNDQGDDTQAFKNALAALQAAGGGTLTVPTGTYLFDTTVTAPIVWSNISVHGTSAVLQAKNAGFQLLEVNGSNVVISGITLDGNGLASRGMTIDGVSSNVLVENTVVENITQTATTATAMPVGIQIEGSTSGITLSGITVRNVQARYDNCNGCGTQSRIARGVLITKGGGTATSVNDTIENSTFSDVGPKDDGDCIVIQATSEPANLQILSNTFTRCAKRAVKVQVPDVLVAYNTVNNPFTGQTDNPCHTCLPGAAPYGMYAAVSTFTANVTVYDNTIDGGGNFFNAIDLDNLGSSPLSGITVQQNTVSMGPSALSGTETASLIRSSTALSGPTIADNALNTAVYGIRLDAAVTNGVVCNNTITNVTYPTFGAGFTGGGQSACTDQLDQSAVLPPTTGDAGGVDGYQWAAQTFTAGISGCMTRAALPVWDQFGNPGTLTVQLVSVDATSGAPTSSVLAQISLPQSALLSPSASRTTSDGNYIFTTVLFPVPAAVTAGKQYALVLNSANSGQGMYYWAIDGSTAAQIDHYPAGSTWYKQGSDGWYRDPGYPLTTDFQFQTYVLPTAAGQSCAGTPTLQTVSPETVVAGSTATIALAGSGFTPASVVEWNGAPLPTSFESAGKLTATVPPAAAGTAQITVANPPLGGTSNPLPLFVTQTSTTISSIGTATSTGGTATTSAGGTSGSPGSASVTATGSGTVSVALYTQDPRTAAGPAGGSYFDVYMAPGSSFSTVQIVDCTGNGQLVSWWDSTANGGAGAWTLLPASEQQPNTPAGCTTITLTTSSSPSTVQLSGTPFVAAKVTAASLKALIAQMVKDPDEAGSLEAKVDSVAQAPNANAKAGKLAAFANEVHAQTGATLSAGQASLLILLAQAL